MLYLQPWPWPCSRSRLAWLQSKSSRRCYGQCTTRKKRGSGISSHSQSHQIFVLFANARSILNKRSTLSSIIDTCDAKIIALTETWLPAHTLDSELFHDAHNYLVYRCERTKRRGGGVLLAVSKDIPSCPIQISSPEITWVLLTLGHSKLVLGTCYRSPSSSPTFVNDLHDTISMVSSRFPSCPTLLLGDFNFPNITWNTMAIRLSSFSQQS